MKIKTLTTVLALLTASSVIACGSDNSDTGGYSMDDVCGNCDATYMETCEFNYNTCIEFDCNDKEWDNTKTLMDMACPE